ncbi:MAG: DUF72 domain-containing protein [Chloroflexi bacterium]|nr:DUF72 domain-containing protein [Chloroflexota bacterium]
MPVLIGTSGWQYRHWRGRLYPEGLPTKAWLDHYAQRFQTVESNNAFYRLPERDLFARWAATTPADFVFSVKVSRYLTHIKRLREPAEPVARFLDHAAGLGSKLGPALLQLPPNLKADHAALTETLECFEGRVRVAVEFRHPSWFTDETKAILEAHDAALCFADGTLNKMDIRSRPVAPFWRTTGWGYVRLHHGAATPDPCYGRTALKSWAERLADLFDVRENLYVYFNNDEQGCAPANARTFAPYSERAGLRPTRVAREVLSIGDG